MNNWIGFHVSTKQSHLFFSLVRYAKSALIVGHFACVLVFFGLTTMKIISVIKLLLIFVICFFFVDVVRIVMFGLIWFGGLPKYHIFK